MSVSISITGAAGEPGVAAGEALSFRVQPGVWTVSARAVGRHAYDGADFQYRILRGLGATAGVTVAEGQTNRVNVTMISAAEAANHSQLFAAISQARTNGGEKIIIVTQPIAAAATYAVPDGANVFLSGAQVSRAANHAGAMFDVAAGGALGFGRESLGAFALGPIAASGAGPAATGPIARVAGTLAMAEGSALTGNNRPNGTGGAVEVLPGGEFAMGRRSITRNAALLGGGVFVSAGGAFTQGDGATINGNQPQDVYRQTALIGFQVETLAFGNPNQEITPIANGAYTERAAIFQVTVEEFALAAAASGVGLDITPLAGFAFAGHGPGSGVFSAAARTLTFTVTATYDGARGGHLERSDLTDAGGLRTRRRAVGRETILQQSKIDSRARGPRRIDAQYQIS